MNIVAKDGKVFYVHSCVMAATSSVLEDTVAAWIAKSANSPGVYRLVVQTEISSAVLPSLIQCLYMGNIKVEEHLIEVVWKALAKLGVKDAGCHNSSTASPAVTATVKPIKDDPTTCSDVLPTVDDADPEQISDHSSASTEVASPQDNSEADCALENVEECDEIEVKKMQDLSTEGDNTAEETNLQNNSKADCALENVEGCKIEVTKVQDVSTESDNTSQPVKNQPQPQWQRPSDARSSTKSNEKPYYIICKDLKKVKTQCDELKKVNNQLQEQQSAHYYVKKKVANPRSLLKVPIMRSDKAESEKLAMRSPTRRPVAIRNDTFRCETCSKIFIEKRYLYLHILTTHEIEREREDAKQNGTETEDAGLAAEGHRFEEIPM